MKNEKIMLKSGRGIIWIDPKILDFLENYVPWIHILEKKGACTDETCQVIYRATVDRYDPARSGECIEISSGNMKVMLQKDVYESIDNSRQEIYLTKSIAGGLKIKGFTYSP
ncbi:MAG: hypothetical protein M1375_05225 [Candidatus Thermoplasmatota archaeon]|jgi:hypothetical protein|nr:hypothetical protein [Candidatus Thermoplasmatota archaeon]MCL5791354.1 hypothetical protein [Candidatus Thermoplasmatota archaeon]